MCATSNLERNYTKSDKQARNGEKFSKKEKNESIKKRKFLYKKGKKIS